MEQHNNTTLAGHDFTGSPGNGDVDLSAVQAFTENRDYEHVDQEAVEFNLEANPVSWTNGLSADEGSAHNPSGVDDAVECANVDFFEDGINNTVDDDLFGGDHDLDESAAGDEAAPATPSFPVEVEEIPPLNPYALALPPAASQQPIEPFREPASSGDAVVARDADNVAAPQNPGFPDFDFNFDFNTDPSKPGFDLNDLMPLEEDLLPRNDADLQVFAAYNANCTVNQSGAEFGVQKPEVTLPEHPAAPQAVDDNAEAVMNMTDEELAKLLEADLANLSPLHDDQVGDNSASAVALEPLPDIEHIASTMGTWQPIPPTLPDIHNCETNPGMMPENVFFQSHKPTVGGPLPLKNYPPTNISTGTNVGPGHFSPVACPEVPAPSYNTKRSRDEFQNDGYSAPQPSQPFAKKLRREHEQLAGPGGPNIEDNLPQQTVGGNASSYHPGVPVTGPVDFPPQQAVEAQRPVGNQHQQACVKQGVNVPQRPPVQPPVPAPVLPPVIHDGYQPLPVKDRNWGVGVRGRHIFQYTDKGDWVYGQVYTADQIKNFICGENRDGLAPSRSRLTLWIQSTLNGYKNRYPQPVKCRWKDCPVKHRTITQGQYRVCFDEHSDTSGRTTDPFHNTGYMHLYCFEQCAPLVSLIKTPPGTVRVAPDDRRFFNTKENGNPMQLGGSFAAHGRHFIDLYTTWVEATWPKWQNRQMTNQDTLYYALADLHLRMFPNRQTTVAHLREYMGDLRRMQELRDQKGQSRLKRDRVDDDDDVEEDERPRQRVKAQNLGHPQPATPTHSQEHPGSGYEASIYGQGPSQPANNGTSQRYGQPQPGPPIDYQEHPRGGYGDYTHADAPSQPAHNPPRHDGYNRPQPPAPRSSYKRPRADDDDGTYEFEHRDDYGTGYEPHTPKRVKVSTPSAPHRQHNSRYGRPNEANTPGPRSHSNPQRPVNLPTLDNPFTIDPFFEINPHFLNPSLNPDQPPDPTPYYPVNPQPSSGSFQSDADLTALPNQNSHFLDPDSNPSSSYPGPIALSGRNNHFLAPEPQLSPEPAHTPTRYSDPSDADMETWGRGPSSAPPPPASPAVILLH